MPTREEVGLLLHDLCVTYGFCLPSEEKVKLTNAPPDSVDEFTDAVYRAEGMDPYDAAPGPKRLREKVRARVAEMFEATR